MKIWMLLKSGTKYFLRSRLTVIMLMVVAFFTSLLFSLIFFTTRNMSYSYDRMVTQGNLHDFTVDESYLKPTGSVEFKVKLENVSLRARDASMLGTSAITYHNNPRTGDPKYIYGEIITRPNPLIVTSVSPTNNTAVANSSKWRILWRVDKTPNYQRPPGETHTLDVSNQNIAFALHDRTSPTPLNLSLPGPWKDNPDLTKNTEFTIGVEKLYLRHALATNSIQAEVALENRGDAIFTVINASEQYQEHLDAYKDRDLLKIKNGIVGFTQPDQNGEIQAENMNPQLLEQQATVLGRVTAAVQHNQGRDWTGLEKSVSEALKKKLVIEEGGALAHVLAHSHVRSVPVSNQQGSDQLLYLFVNNRTNSVSRVVVDEGKATGAPLGIDKVTNVFLPDNGSEEERANRYSALFSQDGSIGEYGYKINYQNEYIYDTKSQKIVLAFDTKISGDRLKFSELMSNPDNLPLDSRLDSFGFEYVVGVSVLGERRVQVTVSDPTKTEAVISTKYAETNKKRPIDKSVLYSFDETSQTNRYFDDFGNLRTVIAEGSSALITRLELEHPQSAVRISNDVVFAVVGIGQSPDYMFPVIDYSHVAINPKNEVIIFSNEAGYESISNDNSLPKLAPENYRTVKILEDLNEQQKESIIETFQEEAARLMVNVGGISWARSRLKTGLPIINNMAYLRIMQIDRLTTQIRRIAIVSAIMLVLIGLACIIIAVRRKMKSLRRTLGILEANGFTRNQIALTFLSIPVMLVAIPTIIGYVAAFFLQRLSFGLFSDYWTISEGTSSFVFLHIFLITVIPVLLMIGAIYTMTMIMLRASLTAKISEADSQSPLSRIFARFSLVSGIRMRYAISLFSANITKMTFIGVALMASVATLAVALASLGKFSLAEETFKKVNNYAHQIELTTPTWEGGQYSAMPLINYSGCDGTKGRPCRETGGISSGMNQFQSQQEIIDGTQGYSYSNYTTPPRNPPSPTAAWTPENNIQFLNHGVIFKPNLDFPELGDANPWKFVARLRSIQAIMDELSRNHAEFSRNVALLSGHSYAAPAFSDRRNRHAWFNYERNAVSQNPNTKLEPMLILFNQVTVDTNDETYTYISAEIDGAWDSARVSINGIRPRSQHYNMDPNFVKLLSDFEGVNLNAVSENPDDDFIPVLANRFVVDKFQTKVGDIININVLNSMDRLNPASRKVPRRMKIVGVIETFQGIELVTLQSYANRVISNDLLETPVGQEEALKRLISNNGEYQGRRSFFSDPNTTIGVDTKGEPQLFNGILTAQERDPRAIKNFAFYSPYGIYPGVVPPQDEDTSIYTQAPYMNESGSNFLKRISSALRVEESWVTIFKGTPDAPAIYEPMFSYARSSNAVRLVIRTSTTFVSGILWALLLTVLLLASAFCIIMAVILLEDNRRNITTLKVMGYSNSEISLIFSQSYVPAMLFGAVMALPLSLGMVTLVKLVLINFGSVTVPISVISWETGLAMAVGLLALVALFFASLFYLKRTRLTTLSPE